VLDSDPCRVVDLLNSEDAVLCTSLSSYTPVVVGKFGCIRLMYSDWVLKRAKEIHRVVGVSCVGLEEPFMAIYTVIEAGRSQMVSGSISKLGSKGNRELKRSKCSINYDYKSETSNHASGKKSGPLLVSMALILIEIEGFFGMSWLACSIGGTCLGVLGVILMSPNS